MFYVKKFSAKKSPWILSRSKDEKPISVCASTMRDLKEHHVEGVNFLYQIYKKQFKGAILNEEEGMNMQLQTATFLNAMFATVDSKFLVLVVARDCNIVKWHYHLTVHGQLRVQIITPKTCPEDFDQEHGLGILLSFSNIKLLEYLIDYDYFCVVLDDFDEIALKLVVRKLHGSFNIGLTQRNFYRNPEQKLQWTMLNWCNPGCVGKLGDFYEIDNDNFANFRDNYKHWWLRLTWKFCEDSEEKTKDYEKQLLKWATIHKINNGTHIKQEKSSRKRKQIEGVDFNQTDTEEERKQNKTSDLQTEILWNDKRRPEVEQISESVSRSNSKNSSQDTIIYESAEGGKQCISNYVKLPSMDENPILNSIIRNLEKSPDPIFPQCLTFDYNKTKYDVTKPNCSKAFKREENEDVLLAIIDDKSPINRMFNQETEVDIKKEEIRSQIFDETPCTSKNIDSEEDSSFFQSLIDSIQ